MFKGTEDGLPISIENVIEIGEEPNDFQNSFFDQESTTTTNSTNPPNAILSKNSIDPIDPIAT